MLCIAEQCKTLQKVSGMCGWSRNAMSMVCSAGDPVLLKDGDVILFGTDSTVLAEVRLS